MANRSIAPIETEADNDAAIERISELMGSQPGSPEADELDALATLVDAYESEHYKMDTPDPATTAEFRIDQQGLQDVI